MDRYGKLLDLASAQGKRQYSDVLLPVVRRLSDPVEQDHYLAAIAAATDVSREALTAKLQRTSANPPKTPRKRSAPLPSPDKPAIEYAKAQDHLLALALVQPALRSYLQPITADMLAREEGKQLLAVLRAHPNITGQTPDEADLLRPLADYVKILGLQYEELYQDLDLSELHYEAVRLRARMAETYVKQQKQYLAARLEEADEAEIVALLKRVKRLDALLSQTKGGD
jgi:DNA primase